MRKLVTYCSLFILAGCITDGNTDIRKPTTTHTPTNSNNSGSTTNPRKENAATTNSSLSKLTSVSEISNTILNINLNK